MIKFVRNSEGFRSSWSNLLGTPKEILRTTSPTLHYCRMFPPNMTRSTCADWSQRQDGECKQANAISALLKKNEMPLNMYWPLQGDVGEHARRTRITKKFIIIIIINIIIIRLLGIPRTWRTPGIPRSWRWSCQETVGIPWAWRWSCQGILGFLDMMITRTLEFLLSPDMMIAKIRSMLIDSSIEI